MELKDIERSIITTYRKKIWVPFIKGINDYKLIQENDGFVFAVDNPWNAKITDTGNEILTKKGKKNFCAINESSDYMLLIMRPY